eukprot:1569152-Amphidinium_carterae.1
MHTVQQFVEGGLGVDRSTRGAKPSSHTDRIWPRAPSRILSCYCLAQRSTSSGNSAEERSGRRGRRSWSP